jgi:hypothetical protein
MMDSDVWKLYQDLLNKKYENIDDFLTSSPADVSYYKPKPHNPNIKFEGIEVNDLDDDMNYGL